MKAVQDIKIEKEPLKKFKAEIKLQMKIQEIKQKSNWKTSPKTAGHGRENLRH